MKLQQYDIERIKRLVLLWYITKYKMKKITEYESDLVYGYKVKVYDSSLDDVTFFSIDTPGTIFGHEDQLNLKQFRELVRMQVALLDSIDSGEFTSLTGIVIRQK